MSEIRRFPRVTRILGITAFVVPALAAGLFVLLPGSGAFASGGPQTAAEGEKVYLTRCMSCHQTNGQGVASVFPPLDGSEWVQGEKPRLIRIIMHGVTGPIEVAGTTYQSAMPPWGTFLKDEEIAAVATYIRGSWSNDADAVTTAEVAAVRAETKERKVPYTADELMMDD